MATSGSEEFFDVIDVDDQVVVYGRENAQVIAEQAQAHAQEQELKQEQEIVTPARNNPVIITEEVMANNLSQLSLQSSESMVSIDTGLSSVPEIPVEFHDEEETEPQLSRYASSQKRHGAVTHPLADLGEPNGLLNPVDEEDQTGHEDEHESKDELGRRMSVAESKSSIGALSLALSLADFGPRPKKVRVRTKKKSLCEFSNLYLIQELAAPEHEGKTQPHPLYCVKFSPDGNYVAVAGEEGIIRIWKLVIEDVLAATSEDPTYVPSKLLPIFGQEPVLTLLGHDAVILDLSWSRNNFLLSASMDKTVRLWHCSRSDCLGIFNHPDFVTCVAFHPRDDRLFISGSLDCRIRLWSMAEKSVKAWNELPANNFITAVAFTSSGKYALAGTTTGVCLLFDCDGFTYYTQIHVHSRRGKNKIGKKICGIEPLPGMKSDDERILISTNDSRVRLYTLRDKSMICKFIGHQNESSQIKAFFSDDGEYVISGSENNRIHIWSVENRHSTRHFFSKTPKQHIKACEYFESHSKPVTCAVFAPSQVRHKLQAVGLRPPLYDLPDSKTATTKTSSNHHENHEISADGHIIVAVDLNGKIKVYENNSQLDKWLKE